MSAANPKDAIGRNKLPLHLWPATATAYGAVGLQEGEGKYGRNNFRAASVAASVYVAALKRHIDAYMEGENVAPDSGVPHLANILANAAILTDATVNGTLIDDRNFVPNPGKFQAAMTELTKVSASLKVLHADKNPKHWDARDAVIKTAVVTPIASRRTK